MDAVTQLLEKAHSRGLYQRQPGTVIAAQMEMINNHPFFALAYQFEQPVISNGYVITSDMPGGDYFNLTPYLVVPNLAEGLARAKRLVGEGFCLICNTPFKPQERLSPLGVCLTCASCGFSEVVE